MLPLGFAWRPRSSTGSDLDLALDGQCVAQLMVCADGESWMVTLDRHWPIHAPLVTRSCESRDSGLAGLERWAERHQQRLRDEIAGRRRARWMVEPED